MIPQIYIGCSAYDNGFWSGVFYPHDLERNQRFEFYCQSFSTFEINSTFYKFPTSRILRNWYDKSPQDFLFSVKAPQVITHEKRFLDSGSEIAEFYKVCETGMRDKLACILFQFPPSFDYSPERLELIIKSVDLNFKNVIEFRHASWWIPKVFAALQQNKIIFCSVSYPDLPSGIVPSGPTAYIRLHGDEKLFYSGYSNAGLKSLYTKLKDSNSSEAFVYFNNTASIAGILNALEMNVLTGQ